MEASASRSGRWKDSRLVGLKMISQRNLHFFIGQKLWESDRQPWVLQAPIGCYYYPISLITWGAETLNLERSACTSNLIFQAYVAFIRSVLLYAFPCFSNIPLYLRNRVASVTKRVLESSVTSAKNTFFNCKIDMCSSFFNKIMDNIEHPLRSFFCEKTLSCSTPLLST